MNRVDRIVDLIDNALDDYSASGDAMRWTPEPVAAPSSDVDYSQRPTTWSEGIVWDLINPPWSAVGTFAEAITGVNEVLAVTEADVRGNYDIPMPQSGTGTIVGEDGMFHYDVIQQRSVCPVGGEWSSWLVIRPIPPAESVTFDLSDIDLSAWP